MMDHLALYDRQLRELAARAADTPRLVEADASAIADSRLCGSRVTADICVRGGVIVAHGHRVRACLIGQASAALLARLIIGQPIQTFHLGTMAMRAVLAGQPVSADPPWHAFEIFRPVADFPSRHGAVLLPFEAVEQALRQLAKSADAATSLSIRSIP